METETNKLGRPTSYTPELANLICSRIAEGRSLRSICRDYDDLPVMATIFTWLSTRKDFLEQYEQACRERTEAQQEELLEMGDKAIEHAEEANPKAANAVVSAYKLKADNLKWSMSKMKPKKYGDAIDVTSGGDKIAVLPQEIYAKRNTSPGSS